MAVSESDVRHVASLARFSIDPSRLPVLVNELNGILAHMEVLERVETRLESAGPEAGATPLRDDASGSSIPLALPREAFAPEMKDGFFLVPRLATHEDLGE